MPVDGRGELSGDRMAHGSPNKEKVRSQFHVQMDPKLAVTAWHSGVKFRRDSRPSDV